MSLGLSWAFGRHRSLVAELAMREFRARYRGTLGGVLWSFAQPLFLLGVYTFVFGLILRVPWTLSGDAREFAFQLFAGLLVYNAFSECIIQSPRLISANPNYVRKVVFPLEALSLVTVVLAVTQASIGWLVWLAGHLLLFGTLKPTGLLFPVVFAAVIPVLLGVSLLLAALGTALRDLEQFAGLFAHALLFATPVFFSLDAVPGRFRDVLLLNPLTFIVEQARAVLSGGLAPDFVGLGAYFLCGLVFCAGAYWIFLRLRPTFSDLV